MESKFLPKEFSKSSPALERAIIFALGAHHKQVLDDFPNLPYIVHPLAVFNTVFLCGGVTDEDLLITALLHDTLELTDTPEKLIEEQFGKTVLALVKELTRTEPPEIIIAGMKKPKVREIRSLLLIEDIKKMSVEAKIIKLADRICNLETAVQTRNNESLKRYLRQTKRILEVIPKQVNYDLWYRLSYDLKVIKKSY